MSLIDLLLAPERLESGLARMVPSVASFLPSHLLALFFGNQHLGILGEIMELQWTPVRRLRTGTGTLPGKTNLFSWGSVSMLPLRVLV